MMLTLDTNTLIYYFKGMGNVAHNLHVHKPSQLFLSAIVIYELEVGIAKSSAPMKRRQQLNKFVNAITVLPFGQKEAGFAGRLRADLEKKGTLIGRYDLLIAGTALAHGATLITHNTREFKHVQGLQLLDWF